MVLAPVSSPASHLRTFRVTLPDGAQTTVHVATFALGATTLRVARLPALSRLEDWCRQSGAQEAIVGGFYLRNAASGKQYASRGWPLGELRIAGNTQQTIPFSAPWHELRASVHIDGATLRIARRDRLPREPRGDLLQAGPLLVEAGRRAAIADEGFREGAHQFDSDITAGRHPRAALAHDFERVFAVVCDGRTDAEAGLTLDELATVLLRIGAHEALNLDGGGSASLVSTGKLVNIPRESHGVRIPGGREIATAVVFRPHA